MRRNGVTIRDVAARAGVSITAVSHALNGKGTVSEKTRERVRRVAEELGYQADAFARGMRQSRIDAVGLAMRSLDVLGDYTPEGVDVFDRFAGIFAAKALARGLSLTLVPDISGRSVPPLAFALDGYVVMSPQEGDPVTAMLESRGIPYVTYGREPGRDSHHRWAAEDDRDAARRALHHLEHAGAREIVLLSGTDRNAWNDDYRIEYREWCRRTDVAPRMDEQPERSGVDGGAEAARRIIGGGVPDAVLCMTGRHAAGLQAELQRHGFVIPRDVLVLAASDSEQARSAKPAITAFSFRLADTADALLDMLVQLLDTGECEGPRLTRAQLKPRASTRAQREGRRSEA
ncbi:MULTISPECIES: LacI family DNA-binding transcriptional regulator [Microbacterium]|uniref:LacI family DNA-binding transcriptional regulator n=1 Tax=Microbacterium TaxID=33882 RepID=UPI00217DC9E7|nr:MULTISPECIES: LacI family DNA-binding transcriptional regulator [Microbacterium]UWF77269.1 LacI family DNA-binding transcriptional regulator [Microbacterium neungamense]WCM55426.1 LacI family DNA-binding transcriptional regulator [Microbacterium sp. EF45047]